MDPDSSFEDTIDAALRTLQRESPNPRSTIEPQVHSASRVLEQLKRGQTRFKPGKTLGEGGMGVVHLAEQVTLGRDVAIKTLKPENSSDQAVVKLLQEAWVTGTLEHPNVVPIYDIDVDGEQPRIVLKRIEGEEWGDLMSDADSVRKKFRADDLLEWNLRRLIEVCQALRFAHSRGIIHRDLKPENVMIGEFGEVYVLDWGIAVSEHDDGSGRFPLLSDAIAMAGTPCYMAPEQLGGEEVRISPRTDVYLVGAMLYEMVAGHPPHVGDTFREILGCVLRSSPTLPDEAPPELGRIILRAMDADPDARFENAEQLQLAIEGFLSHRGSRQLSAQADAKAKEMVAAIERADEEAVEVLFSECSFGYRAALNAWSQNDEARLQLQRVTILRIDHELERREVAVASRLLAGLDSPPPALTRLVQKARAAEKKRGAAAQLLEDDASWDIGRRTRAFLSFTFTGMFTVFPLIGAWFPLTWFELTAGTGLFLALILVLGFWARESMSKTRLNRQLGGTIVSVLGVQLVLFYGGWASGMSSEATELLLPIVWCTGAAVATATAHVGLWPSIIGFAAAFLFVSKYPDLRYWAMSGSNGVLMLNLLWLDRALHVFHEARRERVQERREKRRENPKVPSNQ